jgi:hypothetical protein
MNWERYTLASVLSIMYDCRFYTFGGNSRPKYLFLDDPDIGQSVVVEMLTFNVGKAGSEFGAYVIRFHVNFCSFELLVSHSRYVFLTAELSIGSLNTQINTFVQQCFATNILAQQRLSER